MHKELHMERIQLLVFIFNLILTQIRLANFIYHVKAKYEVRSQTILLHFIDTNCRFRAMQPVGHYMSSDHTTDRGPLKTFIQL